MPQQSPARLVRIRNAAEVRAEDARDSVVPGEALVHVRVVGGEQLDHRSVLLHDVREEQFGLTHHRVGERLIEVGVAQRVRMDLVQVLEAEPLARESRPECLGPGVGQHAQHLALQLVRIRKIALVRDVDQLLIGRAAPQEEGEA